MSGASRKTKLSKYEVVIKRQVEHVATVEVEARTIEEAEQKAEAAADAPHANYWREGDVIDQSVRAKVLRG
jgi:DTW domain-containing protein YfiP